MRTGVNMSIKSQLYCPNYNPKQTQANPKQPKQFNQTVNPNYKVTTVATLALGYFPALNPNLQSHNREGRIITSEL
jgi:hypothetical protein